ncbi:BLUF domain-containing protein [Sphingomonas abaci]|uniref:BLUF domain-containing protein n=1 Tax=Sphingomonas abaci TaxID=237611 RepID=A0A7W7AJJ8_9SPHN|nr:BLUF domain-containing protein [Sphingomonas abaci]MBB4617414.1 hypothetical protein [Sphingomonas abaci]
MSQVERVRRIIYSSRATGVNLRDDHQDILAVSRRNNGMDGISGILWIRGDRYLQLLEGPPESVAGTFSRIADDARHRDVVVLDDQLAVERQFGDWAMAGDPGERPEDASLRLRGLLRNADGEVARFFDPA